MCMSWVMYKMPLYKCHKEVHAVKIKSITLDEENDPNVETDYSAVITPEESGFAPFRVSSEYMRKHGPQPGGYYVVYKDGYESYSPAQAFEEGYTLIA